MPICRCLKLHSPPSKGDCKVAYVKPMGYPKTAAICGRVGCFNIGVVWLDKDDVKKYKKGQRIFPIHTHKIKVKVDNKGLKTI